LIAFIVDDSKRVVRAAVAQRGYSAGTALSQVRLSKSETILAPFSLAALPALVTKRVRSKVEGAIRKLGLLTPKASEQLLTALVTQHPEIERVVTAARSVNERPYSALAPQEQLRLQEEKDAAYIALSIAGMDRKRHLSTVPDQPESGQWFLETVTDVRLREDPMLLNDLDVFPEFDVIKKRVFGAVRFQQEHLRLTIILINRQPLEELTGTDLIYFNETFRAFVMVQYKAMESDGDGHIFRVPNKRLDKEIARMNAFHKAIANNNPSGDAKNAADFRLNNSPFFLKFCPRLVEQLGDRELVPGLYFPLEHWRRLSSSDILVGDRGGRALRFDKRPPTSNAGRYLNNTEFANLVRGAWVGTVAAESNLLQQIVEDTLEQGRSVTLAVASETTQKSSDADD
jgi:hypothetical protein